MLLYISTSFSHPKPKFYLLLIKIKKLKKNEEEEEVCDKCDLIANQFGTAYILSFDLQASLFVTFCKVCLHLILLAIQIYKRYANK